MRERMGSQDKEMYPEKIEMVVDPAQNAPSLWDDWSVQRRHRDVFLPSEYWESGGGESPLVVADGGSFSRNSSKFQYSKSILIFSDKRAVAACSRVTRPQHTT